MSEPSKWAELRAFELTDGNHDVYDIAKALDAARREGCRIGLEAALSPRLIHVAIPELLDPDAILRERDEGE